MHIEEGLLMHNFTYYVPTEVIFGKGAEMDTVAAIRKHGGKRVVIVYGGGSVKKNGLLQRVEEYLSSGDIPYITIGGVKPNPHLSLARDGVKAALDFNADFVLAVGGGSVIDTAKGIAHGAANPNIDIWEFWLGKKTVDKSLPVGVILTIPAAGSEMSDSAVLTNEETGEKKGFPSDFNRPRFAIMDPELTFTLPDRQIACGIVDIMMHTLDRYFTPQQGNELTDEFAESLLRTTIKNGQLALDDKTNYQAMSELMWCGSVSHNGLTGLGGIKDFGPHKLGHELSGKFDIAHGESLSAIWGAWANYVYKEDPQRFAQYARNVWDISKGDPLESAEAGILKTVEFFKSLGMPTCFAEAGIGGQNDAVIDDLAMRCTGGGKYTVAAFKKLSKVDAYNIYSAANH